MDEKTLHTLEFPKILDRLAGYASFSASSDLAHSIRPTDQMDEALRRQAETTEARHLLSVNDDLSVGGAHDIRPLVDLAQHGGVLEAVGLLDVKTTLIAARSLARSFDRLGEQFPHLAEIAVHLTPPPGIIDNISQAISERGEVMDSASPELGRIRRELKVSHDRMMSRLERIINDPRSAPMLQESLITQRNGRYVIPLRSEFKGRVRSIIHDQSASGATLFVEPLVIVELNNQLRELQLAERDEERKILQDLSRQVGFNTDAIILLVEALAAMDLAFMRAKYAEDLHASEPVLVPFREKAPGNHPGSTIRLYDARHPLLDQAKVVSIDVDLDEDTFGLVVTGPNTGGKTVTLKTVGLLSVMAQSGLHIPAQSGSEVSLFQEIYADIGDEQSIEQSLSTFSGHITNIVRILKAANRYSLVLLDELGAGTDPQEGSALARAIVSHLLENQVTCLVATHYPELKAFAHSTRGLVNASVEFDLQTLRPTYRLVIGLPGRSNALAIAERLGLPIELITAARSTLDPNDLRADDLLDEIHHQRDLARKARESAERLLRESEQRQVELVKQLDQIEEERLKILEKARQDTEHEAASLRDEMDQVRRDLTRARQPLDALKPLEEEVESIEETAQKPIERKIVQHSKNKGPLKLGERIHLRSLNMDGIITSLGETEAEVQVGNLRVRARRFDLQRKGEEIPVAVEPAKKAPRKSTRETDQPTSATNRPVFHESPGMELDLRGQRAEDALIVLDRYLESAYLAGLPFIRIIHGKGTGRLRQVVRDALHQSPHVASWETGLNNEGGDGVTVAKLVTD